ncbi:Crp/Fnr family transcriptional regulator [Mucilaginibacter sp. 14171R-50]|uniref:Crp/Fnr family transcriptional regulator n=1 Tax=Mucilaginibacter sp. 14171R-50 TaxID=2703789 RepID=UPI00138D6A9A|nr:Crp/Fnr family transcriptional regulator [Mucilaginibacter sp. 14171R-50]QHS56571.1 Crp/Fnr family transcriptional regulator [Mucilaginibacter sp. 14171R-50]
MNAELLIQTLNFISPLSSALDQRFRELLKEERLPKRTLLLRAGEVSRKIYFINEGFARAFHLTRHGRECTSWFMGRGDLMISVYSFYTQKPAEENIELLENSELLSMTWNQLQSIYAEFPEYNFTGRLVTEKYYMLSEERTILLRTSSARERYEKLLQLHPGITQKATLGQVASYLGITPETLSRVRGNKTVLT